MSPDILFSLLLASAILNIVQLPAGLVTVVRNSLNSLSEELHQRASVDLEPAMKSGTLPSPSVFPSNNQEIAKSDHSEDLTTRNVTINKGPNGESGSVKAADETAQQDTIARESSPDKGEQQNKQNSSQHSGGYLTVIASIFKSLKFEEQNSGLRSLMHKELARPFLEQLKPSAMQSVEGIELLSVVMECTQLSVDWEGKNIHI